MLRNRARRLDYKKMR
ncbi:hypothetical protein AB2F15_12300 [Escherichia coli]|nr:hypothetical protein [Escherichia coli]MEB6009423.1 hypothetical protein [Escherichia coli]